MRKNDIFAAINNTNMGSWTIYNKSGVAKAVVKELELHDEWMAECYLTITVKSAQPISFAVGDYIDYRNERYTIEYDPNEIKKSASGTYGEGFVYENIKFVGAQDEVVRCDFNDIVLSDNNVHYTALPTFPFYCESVDDLLDRIQANLEDLYPNGWIVIGLNTVRNYQRGNIVGRAAAFEAAYRQWVDPDLTPRTDPYGKQSVAETADNITCWDALTKVHDDFGLNFIVRGKVIIVGTAGVFTANTFRYGKGNGLSEIEKLGDSSQQIVTRLRAYGSETNMPLHYYSAINMLPYGLAIGSTTDGNVQIDVDFKKEYFVHEFSSGETDVVAKVGNTEYNAKAYINGSTGKINLNLRVAVSVTANAKVYITEGVKRDMWPSDHKDYAQGALPENMAVSRLMLPMFPNQSLYDWVKAHRDTGTTYDDATGRATYHGYTAYFSKEPQRPYIDSLNKDDYGIRPASIYFDGSNDTVDIHPTIEGMTYNSNPIDVIYAAEQIDDNGVYDDSSVTVPNFNITLPNLGFNLAEVYEENASIDVKDGMCGGRSFKIASKPTQDANGRWVCECQRAKDDSLALFFPYNDFQIASGDHYVLTGIQLPDEYISAASVRMVDATLDALFKNHAPRLTYQPKIDYNFMQRQHDTAMASQGVVSLHDTLKAGDVFVFADADMGIDKSVIIDQLTIKENGEKGIPTYEISLRDEKDVSPIQKLQNKIDSVISGAININSGVAGLTAQQVRSLINNFGGVQFLSKLNNDTAAGYITMLKGLQIGANFVPDILGEGGVLRKREDGKVELVTDILYARVKAYFDSVEIREYQHTGGNRIASVAGNKICRVAWFNSSNVELEQIQANLASVAYFRCYFRASDGEDTVRNNWVIGDQAYCHITSVTTSSDNPEQKGLNQKHLWRLVIGRNTEGTLTEDGEAYIDLSNRATETISGNSYTGYQSGSDIPEAQDDIIQLGNVNDTTRQGAIVEFVTGTDAPSYQIYQGINSFSLNGKNQIGFGYNTATGKADMKVYGDAYIGARDRSTFIEYKQSGTGGNPELNIKAHVEFTNSNQELDTLVQSHQRDDSYDDTAVRGLIDGLQDQIDGQIESWFYNYAPVAVDSQGAPTSNVPSNVEPYKSWNDADVAAGNDAQKIAHLGDTFTNNKTGYCWRFTRNSSTNAFEWTIIRDSAVITALQNAARAQDTADHKRRVFLTQPTPPYDAGDMWVNAVYPANYTGVTDEANHNYNNDILKCVTAKASDGSFSINDWALASKYTDDSKFNGYISALLNNTGLSGDSAAAAVQNAILGALGVGTVVAGGLLLTSLIGMRQYNGSGDKTDVANYTTWAGISGQYNANVLGGGMAAWYGGGMLDKETLTDTQISQGWSTLRWAKGVDRFDGSGYRADGNISWDANGALTIKNITTLSDSNNKNILNELATFNSAFTFGTSGEGSTTALYITPQVPFKELYIGTSNANKQEVATKNWVNQNFVTTTFFDNIFRLYNGTESAANKIAVNGTLPTDKTNLNIEAMFGFWTKKYISALGQGDDGSTSYTTLAQLNDVNLTNPTANQVLSYNGTHWVNKSIELGSQTLADLTDVVITSPAANQMLGYDATTQKWKNIAIPATGVTSVALSMPTGFSITGSPITASGTFTVAFASGYSLPTTAKQSNWDTAYGWGDHADAGYALAADLGTASSHSHSDYLTSLSWDSTNKKLAWSKGGAAQTAITIGYASVAGSVAWSAVTGTPTTIADYGITDAKIANGVITLGANTITPVTTLYTLSVYGGTTKVLDFKPNANASLYIKAGGDISLTNDTTNKYITLSYSHPTNGADTTIAAANGRVLSAITVNSLGHVTSVSSKTLAAADIPSLGAGKITSGTFDAARIPDLSETYAAVGRVSTLESYFNSGAAKKADKLTTKRSLWGNDFDGSADINGNIVMNSANGTYIQIGAIRIVYDSANNALKVVKNDGTTAANFYATGGISALGETSDGTAGVGDVTWALLADNTDTRQIARSHLTTALTPYATQDWVAANFNNYSLPLAANGTRGGIQVGYTTSIANHNYAVQLSSEKAYVNIPLFVKSGSTAAAGLVPAPSTTAGTTKFLREDGTWVVPDGTFSLSAATSTALGGIKIGYSGTTAKTYAVVLDSGNKAYVSVPWENTWIAWAGATSTAAGTAGYMPAPTSAQRNQFLRGDGTWVSLNNYSLPTASADTLGGVKVGTTLAISSGVLNLPTTGVAAGTYKRVTVDAYGRVTSGDNTDTDTWRGVYVDGVSKVGTGVNTKAINFKAGSNVSLSFAAAGTGSGQSTSNDYFNIVISATDTTYSAATQSAAGLMSAADKKKLDGVAEGANNYSLPLATSGTRGGVKIGYSETNSGSDTTRNYAVQLSSEKMYVNVPWVNTWRGIQNNLTSDSTSDSLSAAQGKALKGYIDTLNGYFSDGVAKSAAKLTTVSKTLFGNTYWTSSGVPTSIGVSGSNASLSYVQNISMSGYIKIGDAYLSYDSTNNAIRVSAKANGTGAVNFYAVGGVSALGETADGQAGVGDVTWVLLADGTDTRQIALSHLTTSLTTITGGTTDATNKRYAVYKNSSNQLFVDVPWQAGAGTVTSVKVGATSYTPDNGVISLPAYPTVPTKVSQLTNDSGYITSYTNTWRNIYVSGTEKLTTAITTKGLNFAAGSNVSLSFTAAGSGTGQNANYGTITISATDTTYSVFTASANGLVPMASSGNKTTAETAVGNYYLCADGKFRQLPANAFLNNTYTVNNGSFTIKSKIGTTTTSIGSTSANASGNSDVTLIQGTNVTFTNDATNRTITIAATDTTYSANNGIGLSGTTFYNSGVRAVSINGNYLRVNTNGTNADLTIPYATNAYSSSYSTYATYLNASYSNGDTSWIWNPLNHTQYYAWGEQFKNTNLSTDTADMRLYIAANTTAGGLGLWLNIDGGVNAMTSLYAGDFVQIGNIKMIYDSTNNAIKVINSDGTAANFYATGGVSALGAGSESGGGGDVTWALLASQATGGRTIHPSYISSTLSNYLPLSGGTINGIVDMTYSTPEQFILSNSGNDANMVLRFVQNNYGYNIGVANYSNPLFYIRDRRLSHTPFIINNGVTAVYNNVDDGSLFPDKGMMVFKAMVYPKNYFGLVIRALVDGSVSLQSQREANDSETYTIILNREGGNVCVGNVAANYKLNVAGTVGATGFTNTSDIRKKNRIKDVDLRLDQIAKAPTFEYYWLDPNIDHDLHVGTSAQYWESVLPQVVTTAKDEIGTKAMQYGVAALISAITVARKVMTHEEKIALLETRVSALEKENGEQEMLINSLQEELAKFKAA